jgi:hypothetical protein
MHSRFVLAPSAPDPRWGCLCLWPLPGVAPRRRNPGLYGRIPLGFPEGDRATRDLRIPGGKTAIARPWAFPDGEIGPRPSTPTPSTSIRGSPPPTPKALWHTARGCAAEALPRVQATSRSLPRKGLCRSCPPGVRYQRAEWDRVRRRGRGVRPECMSNIPEIHTPHIQPIRTIGTTPLELRLYILKNLKNPSKCPCLLGGMHVALFDLVT